MAEDMEHTTKEGVEEPLEVLDLPQLYQKPSAQILLSVLADLSLQPQSWDKTDRSQGVKRKIKSDGVPSYLTKIISSALTWIKDDLEKEQVWEAASQRLSERSGRTAMGAIQRTFSIPLANAGGAPSEAERVSIVLHEPALTGDNLGLKTWASSFLLARRLANFRETLLPQIQSQEQVLELGSGTGLVGLAASLVLKRDVILTDLPEIVLNLQHNIACNAELLNTSHTTAVSAILDWSDTSSFSLHPSTLEKQHLPRSFKLILAADPIYSPSHPTLFVQAVDAHMSRCTDARLVIELPLRDAYLPERQDLIARLEGLGLRRTGEGEEIGYDDWSAGGDGDELDEVRCWWSVWGWHEETNGVKD